MACKRNRIRMRLYEIRKKEAKTFIRYRNLGLSVLNAEILMKTCYDVTKQQKKKKKKMELVINRFSISFLPIMHSNEAWPTIHTF